MVNERCIVTLTYIPGTTFIFTALHIKGFSLRGTLNFQRFCEPTFLSPHQQVSKWKKGLQINVSSKTKETFCVFKHFVLLRLYTATQVGSISSHFGSVVYPLPKFTLACLSGASYSRTLLLQLQSFTYARHHVQKL